MANSLAAFGLERTVLMVETAEESDRALTAVLTQDFLGGSRRRFVEGEDAEAVATVLDQLDACGGVLPVGEHGRPFLGVSTGVAQAGPVVNLVVAGNASRNRVVVWLAPRASE